MKVETTKLPGVLIIDPVVHHDPRGFFVERYQAKTYSEHALPREFVQDNHSRSVKGTLRGMHLQLSQPQGKLVYVLEGSIFDVAVDVRMIPPRLINGWVLNLPETIINAAAYTNVDGAETNVHLAYAANALGPRNLAVVAASLNVPLMHVSTDYVFDGRSAVPYHEFDRPNPLSVYGATKLAGEEEIRDLHEQHFIVRTAWLYHVVGRNFPKTITAMANRPVVRVVDDQVGSPTYAPHLASALARLLETRAYGTYHMAGRGQITWFTLTCELYRQLGIITTVEPVKTSEFPRPAPRPRFSALTTLQSPRIELPPWQEGIAEYVASLRTGKEMCAVIDSVPQSL